MPTSTVASIALGGLIGAALLGTAFDRRSLLVVLVAAAIPDLDAVAAVVVAGAHNALFHTLLIPLAGSTLLYYDTQVREQSWIRGRYGWQGVRTLWVALAAYAFAGIGLDLFNVEGANVLYPLVDQYVSIVGKAEVTTHQGLVQTYVRVDPGTVPPVALGETKGGTGVYRPAPALASGSGYVPLVRSGWQLLLVLSSAAVVVAKVWLADAIDHTTDLLTTGPIRED